MNVAVSWRSNPGDRPDEHGALVDATSALVFYGDVAADVFALGPDPERVLLDAHARLRARGTLGVCAAALVLQADRVGFTWVGDCRVYRVRDGRAERLSRDQTLAEQLAAEGLVASGPLATAPLQRLGLRDVVIIATAEEGLLAGDRLALATVGVWRDRTEVSVLEALCTSDRDRATETLVNGPSPLESTVVIVDVV